MNRSQFPIPIAQHVVSVAPLQQILPSVPDERVVPGAAEQGVIPFPAIGVRRNRSEVLEAIVTGVSEEHNLSDRSRRPGRLGRVEDDADHGSVGGLDDGHVVRTGPLDREQSSCLVEVDCQ